MKYVAGRRRVARERRGWVGIVYSPPSAKRICRLREKSSGSFTTGTCVSHRLMLEGTGREPPGTALRRLPTSKSGVNVYLVEDKVTNENKKRVCDA